jgi:peptidoglycan hydrolase-like protein with peptidoglycan-binding domain
MSKKIYINPGHSEKDPGAVGYEVERELNLKVSNYMFTYLVANYDCDVRIYSHDSLNAVCNDANNWGADLFISNHFNAGGGDGYEALVYSEKRVELGKIFAKHVEAIGQNLRPYGAAPGVKIRTNLHVLKYTHMPAVLNEGAFVDNKKDVADWNEEHELQKLGEAYAKAAAEFLDLPEKFAPAPVPEKSEVYTMEKFIRDVQASIGATVDGIAGPETIGKTITVSANKNNKHPVVKPIQKRLHALGYTMVGAADGIAGAKFEAAVNEFQNKNHCWVDGEITAGNKTWRKLLGME